MAVDKRKLILNDYYQSNCLVERAEIFENLYLGNSGFNIEPYQPSSTIIEIYEDTPNDCKVIFACIHDRLNKLLDFMHEKVRKNRHFNAAQSRELSLLIKSVFSLEKNLDEVGVGVEIRKDYANWMSRCLEFLRDSGGSYIPEELELPEIEKYEPVLLIKDVVTEKRLKNTEVTFSSQYQKDQLELMLAMIKTDAVKAIGMAKEYIETCLQGILDSKIEEDVNKLSIIQLMSKARDYFKLNRSELKEIRAIISGLSQIVNGIAELRNNKGSGHSHTSKIPKPTAIEARLAVDAAITIVNFYSELSLKQ